MNNVAAVTAYPTTGSRWMFATNDATGAALDGIPVEAASTQELTRAAKTLNVPLTAIERAFDCMGTPVALDGTALRLCFSDDHNSTWYEAA
jgi:hypothetical protein